MKSSANMTAQLSSLLRVAGVVLFAAVTAEAAEPMFRGQPVSYWAESYCSNTNPAARQVLEQMGPALAVPALTKLIDKSDVRANEAYQAVHPVLPDSLKGELPTPLRKGAADIPFLAADALSWFGPDAESAVPELIRAFPKRSDQHKREIAGTLASIGSAASPAVSILEKSFSTTNRPLKEAILTAFQQIGPKADSALPLISSELTNADVNVRMAAAAAVWSVGHETNAALRILTGALDDSKIPVQTRAVYHLGELGAAARSAVPILLMKLQSSDPQLRTMVVSSISRIGDTSPEVIRALIVVLQSDPTTAGDVRVMVSAAQALGSFGPAASESIPVLMDAIRKQPERIKLDRNSGIMHASLKALGMIGAQAAEALPLAQQFLKHENMGIRLAAAGAVWGIDGGKTVKPEDLVGDWKANLSQMLSRLEDSPLQRRSLASTVANSPLLMAALAKVDPQFHSQVVSATNRPPVTK